MVLLILVHDPGHHLGVGPHVGRRNIDVRPDHVVQAVDEPPGDAFDLARTECGRIDGDPPLGAAVGQVDHGGLPGHQGGQGADFVQVDFGVIAQPPFHRPPGVVVLHPIADEGADFAVVHFHDDLDRDLALRGQQHPPHVVAQVHPIGGPIEVEPGRVDRPHGRRPARGFRGFGALGDRGCCTGQSENLAGRGSAFAWSHWNNSPRPHPAQAAPARPSRSLQAAELARHGCGCGPRSATAGRSRQQASSRRQVLRQAPFGSVCSPRGRRGTFEE